MTAPSDCRACRERFLDDRLFQAELLHLALTVSPSAAESELNERYGEIHDTTHREKS